MKDRVEIEKAENGYTVKIWTQDTESENDYGYSEPTNYVASDLEEVITILKNNFK